MLFIFPQACIFCDSVGAYYDGRFFECHEGTPEQQREHNKFCKNCAYGLTKIRGRKLRCPKHPGGALHSKRHREDPNTPKPQPVPRGG